MFLTTGSLLSSAPMNTQFTTAITILTCISIVGCDGSPQEPSDRSSARRPVKGGRGVDGSSDAGRAEAGARPLGLHPVQEPSKRGHLEVSDRHELYWEVAGNPKGIPVFVLHGGPGGKAHSDMTSFFDPERFYIILHDQRGAGRSRPHAEWRDNTTQLLVEDINRLREHLGVEGKAILWGGSWGTTLALTYAEAHPDRVSGLVLRGVFLATKAELDHFYHGGASLFFPDAFARLQKTIPHPERLDYPQQLFDMTQSTDPALRERAIKEWAYYEVRMSSVGMTDERSQEIVDTYDLTAFSVLENYYMSQSCFLEEGQILHDAHKIAHIPTFIVNGRFDVVCPPRAAFELASRLQNVKLELSAEAGHIYRERANTEALLRGTRWVADQVESSGVAAAELKGRI